MKTEAREVAHTAQRPVRPWIASFAVVFAAEWGDLTQLATAALVAQSTLKFHRETGEPKSTLLSEVIDTVLSMFRSRLQSMGELKHLEDLSETTIYKALGNAVNAEVVRRIAKELLSDAKPIQALERSRKSRKDADAA